MAAALVLAAASGAVGVSQPAWATSAVPFPTPATCSIQTFTGNFVTAVGGGGHTTDAIHTDATTPQGWETFHLVNAGAGGRVGIQTSTGNYLSATGGVIHTNATALLGSEQFGLVPVSGQPANVFAIQTIDGHYVTAVGGGGRSTDVIHINATVPQSWEWFHFNCDGAIATPPTGVAAAPAIACTIRALDPYVRVINRKLSVSSPGITQCSSAPDGIFMVHTLYVNALAITDPQSRIGAATVRTGPFVACAQGIYNAHAEAEIHFPAGYVPSVGKIYWDTNIVTILQKQCQLPNVAGLFDAAARVAIVEAGLGVGSVTTQVSDAPVGSVISQSLEEGSENPALVNLVESSGNATVPNVRGDNEDDAISRIQGAGLVVGTVTYVNDCIAPDLVESQQPNGGVRVLRGSAVNIKISICDGGVPR